MDAFAATSTPKEIKVLEGHIDGVQVIQNNSGFEVRLGSSQINAQNGGFIINPRQTMILSVPRTVFVKSNGMASLVICSEVL